MATNYLQHHGHIVRTQGGVYKIIATQLGKKTLVDAECVFGPDKGKAINLVTARTPISRDIRGRIGMGLVS